MGFFFASLALMAFWWICAWRCAPNVKNRVWMYAARVIIAFQALYYSSRIWLAFLGT